MIKMKKFFTKDTIKDISIKIFTGSFLFGLADFLSQKIETMNHIGIKKIDNERLIRQSSWGAVSTPFTIFNFYLLNKYFKVKCFKTLMINIGILRLHLFSIDSDFGCLFYTA